MIEFDHMAIAAQNLDDGRDWVENALGVILQKGGNHRKFGTHNMLLGLEDGLYLEVISIDPNAPPLSKPRWFDLDSFTGSPRITNWILRSDELQADLARMPVGSGLPVAVTRGDLAWRMAVPEDGKLPHDGASPAVMQWDCPHPQPRIIKSGLRLMRLTVIHPKADEIDAQMAPLINDARIGFETGAMRIVAEFKKPNGARVMLD